MPTDQETIANLEERIEIALEDSEHAENELFELRCEVAAEKANRIPHEWILDALKDARRAAGHSDTCSTVYRPAPPYDFCDCGCGNDAEKLNG